ncbi:MAG: hypothetical protein AAFV53_39635, partial [Myxococcota bacterium]
MHAKHEALLKKNAKKVSESHVPAFYFVVDKDQDARILHIDRKIKTSAKFGNVKKINQTLKPFESDYQVGLKSKLCAGVVRQDGQTLIFSVEVRRGLSESQLARSLKAFKRFIGTARVEGGDVEIDVDSAEAGDVGESLKAVEQALKAYLEARENSDTQQKTVDNAKGDQKPKAQKTLEANFRKEEKTVSASIAAIGDYIDAVVASGKAAKDGEQAVVLEKRLATWLSELEVREGALLDVVDPFHDLEGQELVTAIADQLREVNLSPERQASTEQATETLNTFLLQQQEIFRQKDTQLDGILSEDELFFTDNKGQKVQILPDFLKTTKLDAVFVKDGDGLKLKASILKDGVITPEARKQIADCLISCVKLGYDLHIDNALSSEKGAKLKLQKDKDGNLSETVTHRKPASPTNLHFDRMDEVVPGSTPPVTFRQAMSKLNHPKDDEEFAAINEMLADAFKVEKAEGKVSEEMSFFEYKLQFADLEVPSVLENGLRWHDGSGSLNAAEWAFLQLRVKDMPETTQHRYHVRLSGKCLKEPFERTMDLKVAPPKTPTEDDVFLSLAREGFWAKDYDAAKKNGFKGKLREYYPAIKMKATIGSWDDKGKLSWADTGEPAFIQSVTGQDVLLPRVNGIPESVRKALMTDVDGTTGDVSSDTVTKKIADTVMKASLTTWAENSGDSIGELLKPIPDTQKIFLRQSNGTVNAVRIGNEEIRGALDRIAQDEEHGKKAQELEALLTQRPPNMEAVEKLCKEMREALLHRRNEAKNRKPPLSKEKMASVKSEYSALKQATQVLEQAELETIGQTDVVRKGNDTGAFGKCAPISYFSGAMCGVGVGAHDALKALQGEDIPESISSEIKTLAPMLTANPMNEAQSQKIAEQLKRCQDRIDAVFNARNLELGSMRKYAIDAHKDAIKRIKKARKNKKYSRKEARAKIKKLNENLEAALQEIRSKYNDAQKVKSARLKALKRVAQLKESIIDRMVVKSDEDGPYLDMKFPVPQSALTRGSGGGYSSGWLIDRYGSPLPDLAAKFPDKFEKDAKTGQIYIKTKVRPGDIQEYLEETNREDKYRGDKSHMMDYFKNPSSMNNIQLMQSLGPGLIAVGLDKGLKEMGKDSGLLYGPDCDTVSTMVYNKPMASSFANFTMPLDKKDPDYQKTLEQRRAYLINQLQESRDNGGGIAVSMGYKSDNGHVNYVQSWGTPTIGGVEISATDLARCRMNFAENPESSSAWNNDRVQDFPINPAAMSRGLESIQTALKNGGNKDGEKTVTALKQKADGATAALDKIAKEYGFDTFEGLTVARNAAYNRWDNK